jgi:hypothetical protein
MATPIEASALAAPDRALPASQRAPPITAAPRISHATMLTEPLLHVDEIEATVLASMVGIANR